MRRPNVLRPIPLTTSFPEDIRAKLDLHCYSESEGRVPKGAIQKFLIERIREYFSKTVIPLQPQTREALKLALGEALSDLPQEWWTDHFANAQEAYLRVREFKDSL